VENGYNGLWQAMICAIAEIESAQQPLAYRYEKKLQEASTGLMQTLQSTAEWLSTYILIVPPSFSHRFVCVCERERQTQTQTERVRFEEPKENFF
jgi:hypothetical protein